MPKLVQSAAAKRATGQPERRKVISRDFAYHGGLFSFGFAVNWMRKDLSIAIASLSRFARAQIVPQDGTAGTIYGGLFLREFVHRVPWAHLDIAGVAFTDKGSAYVPRGAVGWGVRTLVDFVERRAKRS